MKRDEFVAKYAPYLESAPAIVSGELIGRLVAFIADLDGLLQAAHHEGRRQVRRQSRRQAARAAAPRKPRGTVRSRPAAAGTAAPAPVVTPAPAARRGRPKSTAAQPSVFDFDVEAAG